MNAKLVATLIRLKESPNRNRVSSNNGAMSAVIKMARRRLPDALVTVGFPPNFVHSLDSTHMLMTALVFYTISLFMSIKAISEAVPSIKSAYAAVEPT